MQTYLAWEFNLQEMSVVDVVFDSMGNCSYIIFRNSADEYFKFKVDRGIGKKIALLICNAFPLNEKSIYNSYVMLLQNFGLKISSVIISDNKDSQTARLIMNGDIENIEINMDTDDALMIGMIANANLFVDSDTGGSDVEDEIILNWQDLFSKIL